MSTLSGVWAQPAATASNTSSSTSSADSAKISANDFLTLLVTELKNQDPTATTDPNQYINQLVAINSLQQLIAINENLTSSLAVTSNKASAYQAATTNSAQLPITESGNETAASFLPNINAGNITLPAASHAADRIANALSKL